MTANDLTFAADANGRYQAAFTAEGGTVLQVIQKRSSHLSVAVGLGDLDGAEFYSTNNLQKRNQVMLLDVPAGVKVTVTSDSEVEAAAWGTVE